MLLGTTQADSQSEKEVRKNNDPSELLTRRPKALVTASRFSIEYWRDRIFRPTYLHDSETSEVQELYVQIQYRGHREKVGLGTNNKEEAVRRAGRFYTTLREKGWDAAHKQLSPSRDLGPRNPVAVGEFIEMVGPMLSVRPRTLDVYAYALRKIAREAAGSKDNSRHKFDPKSLEWRKAADLLPLGKMTPNTIAQWKATVLMEADQNPVAQQRARRNINSFVRNARAVFGWKILKKLTAKGTVLPAPLPFEGFEFEAQGSTKYVSKINAGSLFQTARNERAEADPESWKVILLALGAGLRRAEIDGLCWSQVDADRGEIRITNHAYFQAKTEDSEGDIFVDPGLMVELGRFRTTPESRPVVDAAIPFRQSTGPQYYRCQETFQRVTSWLRANGVTGNKPLHTLRKEFGSIICAAADIHTASRQLRHSNLATTAAYYADHRRRITVPVAEMLNPPSK